MATHKKYLRLLEQEKQKKKRSIAAKKGWRTRKNNQTAQNMKDAVSKSSRKKKG